MGKQSACSVYRERSDQHWFSSEDCTALRRINELAIDHCPDRSTTAVPIRVERSGAPSAKADGSTTALCASITVDCWPRVNWRWIIGVDCAAGCRARVWTAGRWRAVVRWPLLQAGWKSPNRVRHPIPDSRPRPDHSLLRFVGQWSTPRRWRTCRRSSARPSSATNSSR